MLLKALCEGIEQPPRKPGAGRNLIPPCDAVFAAVMKVYTTLSGRRASTDIRGCAEFAQDSTGFSTVTYDHWFDEKHGKLRAEHAWVKLHVMVGTVTHVVTGGGVRGVFVPRFMDVVSCVRVSDTLADHRTLAAPTARALVAIAWPRS